MARSITHDFAATKSELIDLINRAHHSGRMTVSVQERDNGYVLATERTGRCVIAALADDITEADLDAWLTENALATAI